MLLIVAPALIDVAFPWPIQQCAWPRWVYIVRFGLLGGRSAQKSSVDGRNVGMDFERLLMLGKSFVSEVGFMGPLFLLIIVMIRILQKKIKIKT